MKKEKDEICVSICCLVYNHEKYLRKCLDGFMMQRDVTFEVLIHDDASTDRSAEIIREYEQKYPDIIKPIYQTENQYSKGVKISGTFQYPRARGKYIAMCEGDDFWTDPYKLKKQVDALDANRDCHCCFSRVQGISEDGITPEILYPAGSVKSGILHPKEYYSIINRYAFPFQISGFMIETEYIKSFAADPPEYAKKAPVGDLPIFLYSGTIGNVYYFEQTMSCYRRGVPASWTNTRHRDASEKFLDMYVAFQKQYPQFDISPKIAFSKSIVIGSSNGYLDAYRCLKGCKKKNRLLIKQMLKFLYQGICSALDEKLKKRKQ